MSCLQEILEHNERFVASRGYEPYRTSKFPDKKLVVVSCMDTRLTDLLPRAMNLKNGDAKFLKNAGAIVSEPFGSIMKGIVVAIFELGAREVLVVGHHGCGMAGIDPKRVMRRLSESGIPAETLEALAGSGISLERWLEPVTSIPESVRRSVDTIRSHPLIPDWVQVHGLVVDPETGKLELVVDGQGAGAN